MTIHERLRKARTEAGFTSVTAAAKRFGFNANTLRSNENGNKPYGREAAEKYAKAFKVRLDWLLSGRGPMKAGRAGVAVQGQVGAGAQIFPLDEDCFELIEPSFEVDEGVIAFVVRGDSMWPQYVDGDYILAKPVDEIQLVLHRRAVVTLEDGRRLLKTVEPGRDDGFWTLSSHNSPPIPDVVIVAAARVVGVVHG
jgi:transcriptional regulator with XRE-family HTH domain